MRIGFVKMQAYGNDYVYINTMHQPIDDPCGLSKKMSDRHFGIGSDGIVLIMDSTVADFRMRMFNPDGTEGEMCGNALRSLSKFVYIYRLTDKTEFTVETLGGIQKIWLDADNGNVRNITADIGLPVLDTKKIPVLTELPEFVNQPVRILDREFLMTALSWGNPHVVMFVDDVDSFEVAKYGPAIETHTQLFQNRTNVTFAQIISRDRIKIREWERGTGETIGCGTGCCTAVVAAGLLDYCDRYVTVDQIGGPLEVKWAEDGHVFMIGPSHIVFEGVYEYEPDKVD